MTIDHLDHLVLTGNDLDATCAFYQRLGMEVVTFEAGRTALRFGDQKINMHPAAAPIAGCWGVTSESRGLNHTSTLLPPFR